MTENRERELTKDFEGNKKKSISYYVDQMKAFKRQFVTLNRNAKTYAEDTTTWPLYLCYQFLKGKLNDNVAIKAPLVIIKTEIVEEGNKGKNASCILPHHAAIRWILRWLFKITKIPIIPTITIPKAKSLLLAPAKNARAKTKKNEIALCPKSFCVI